MRILAAVFLASATIVAPHTATTTTTTTTTTTDPTPRPRPHSRNENPFANPGIRSFLASRADDLTAGLYDVATGRTYLYRPGVLEVTASLIKVDILAVLLREAQASHRPLSTSEQALATVMIEDSNNVAAQELWNEIGGFGLSSDVYGTGGYYAITNFDHLLGFRQTVTNWGWGYMESTPADFLRLLRAVWLPDPILTSASAHYERSLMESVTAAQRFGVPSGVPSSATVGVKVGWLFEPTIEWQFNSAGYVHAGTTTYLAVIMTDRNPNQTYGIDTLDTLGSLLWHFENSLPPSR